MRFPASATPSSRAQGGVSGGLYASLNGGVGSRDSAAHVAENRARMAAALGGRAASFAHRPPGPLAACRGRYGAVAAAIASARRRHRHLDARPRDRRDHGRLRPDPSRRSAGPRDRRGACRLARRARRRPRGNGRGDGAARRRAQPDPRRARPDDPATQLRGRRRSHRALCRRGFAPASASSSRHRAAATRCSIWPAISRPGCSGRAFARSRMWACAPTPIRRGFSASAARPTAPKPITAVTSTPLL